MPDWTYCKIEFKLIKHRAFMILDDISTFDKQENLYFDFEKLIPIPDYIYRDDIGSTEENDFGKEKCWYEWCYKNWGTKWNSQTNKIAYHKNLGKAVICFATAWNPPYPVIIAFGNKFKIPFIFKYYEESSGRFGKETWKLNEFNKIKRTEINNDVSIKKNLRRELIF